MRHSTALTQELPGPRTAQLACRLAVLALLTFAATASGQETAPSPEPSPTIAANDPLVPNVSYAPGQYAKIEGTIVSRKGDALLVRRQNSNELSVVTLTERTDVESPAGVLNLERKKQEMSKLQKGLFLKVRGHGGDQKELVAERISFHRSALRVTNQIASGEVELREEMEARLKSHNDSLDAARDRARTEFSSLTARIADLDAYDEKFSGSVRFATGSSMLSAEAKSTLDSLVDIGKGLNGSLVEIPGHADSRGSPEFNRQLSQRRVESVVAYLNSAHAVPLRKIVNPTGIGEANPIGSNNTEEGRALNRRVEIRILVNRGMNAADPMTEANRPKAKTTPEIKPESKPDAMPDASQAPKSDAIPQPNQDAIPDSVPAPKQP